MHAGIIRQGRRRLAHGLCRRHAEHALGAARADWHRTHNQLHFRLRRRSLLPRPDRVSSQANGIGIGAEPDHPGRSSRPLCDHARTEPNAPSPIGATILQQGSSRPTQPALAKSLENQALVYFSGITLAILDPASRKVLLDAVGKARKAGSLVAFDANYRPRLWKSPEEARAAIDEALSVTDIALPTFPDEQSLYGDTSPEATAEQAWPPQASEKSWSRTARCRPLIRHDGQVETIAASTGRIAGRHDRRRQFLQRQLSGRAPCRVATAEATRRAHAVAAAVVQVRGALAPFETLRAAFGA